jgi:formylglycine-generating enzyme required for sulfatase activity
VGDAAARGLGAYEFLGNVEEWTRMWTEDQVDCVSLRSYPVGFHGATVFGADALRFAAVRVSRLVRRKAAAT